MIFCREMQVYMVYFESGSKLSLMAYNYAQARLLAEQTIPHSSISSIVTLGPFDR